MCVWVCFIYNRNNLLLSIIVFLINIIEERSSYTMVKGITQKYITTIT